jgi:hypothetical protein
MRRAGGGRELVRRKREVEGNGKGKGGEMEQGKKADDRKSEGKRVNLDKFTWKEGDLRKLTDEEVKALKKEEK